MSRKNPFSFGAPGPDPQPVPPQTASQEVPGNPFGNPFATPPSVAAAAAVPPNLFADGGDDDDDPFAPPKAAAAARPSPRNDHVTQVSPTRSPAPPRRAAGPTPAPGHVDITPKRAAAAITAAVTVPQLPAAAPPPPPSFTDHIDHAEAVLQRDALARTIALMRSSAPVTGGGGDIPSDAVTTAVAGGPLLLERFRSARQKEQLLDAATASLHGDIIKLAGRFVLSTMAPTLAAKVFVARPVACQHMIQWFRTRHEWAELAGFCTMVGGRWLREAGLAELQLLNEENAVTKRGMMLSRLVAAAERGGALQGNLPALREALETLKVQVKLEGHDANPANTANNAVFQRFPKRAPVTLTPAITTLFYGVMYHSADSPQHPGSPALLKTALGLTESEFIWTAVRAHVQLKDWAAVDGLMTVKSTFRGTKLQPSVDVYSLAKTLLNGGAPTEVLMKYVALVENLEHRLLLCTKAKAHTHAVQALIDLKDRRRLEAYYQAPDVIGDFVVRRKALDALENPKLRWN